VGKAFMSLTGPFLDAQVPLANAERFRGCAKLPEPFTATNSVIQIGDSRGDLGSNLKLYLAIQIAESLLVMLGS
jgi:hypothetical protein